MSLEKKSTHVRLSPEIHERAKTLAEIKGKDLAQYLAFLVEKEIVGEWHVLNLQAKSFERLGLFLSCLCGSELFAGLHLSST